MLHISDGNSIYWEHSFGPGVRNFGDALDEMRPTHFGVAWQARRVLTVLVDEQLHHGAEVALLRDLYRYRANLSPTA